MTTNAKAILRALSALNSDTKAADYSTDELLDALKDCNAAIKFFDAPRLRDTYTTSLRELRRAQSAIQQELQRRKAA